MTTVAEIQRMLLFRHNLHAIHQMTMDEWLQLAEKLGVERNERSIAARKLTIRELSK